MLNDAIVQIIGTYNPLVNPDGTFVNTVSGLDFPYIVRAIILIVSIWGVTMIINTLVKMIGGKK